MPRPRLRPVHALAAALLCAGCVAAPGGEAGRAAETAPVTAPVAYDGIVTRLLDDDLVNIGVRLSGGAARDDVTAYARCAAAQYTLIRGFGFARHVRTNVQEVGGVWTGDAVYTISQALPRGLQTIDAEVAVAECAEQGIPTV